MRENRTVIRLRESRKTDIHIDKEKTKTYNYAKIVYTNTKEILI